MTQRYVVFVAGSQPDLESDLSYDSEEQARESASFMSLDFDAMVVARVVDHIPVEVVCVCYDGNPYEGGYLL